MDIKKLRRLLNPETMQLLLSQDEIEPIINIPVVKTIKVRFNKPKRLKFYSIEDYSENSGEIIVK